MTTQHEILRIAEKLTKQFYDRTQNAEQDGDWLLDHVKLLKQEKFMSLTVPKEYGGAGLNLYEFLQVIEVLAKGDGATALSIGWHLGCILENAENRSWKESFFKELSDKIVHSQALVNIARTELATGSPSRGGLPETTAVREGEMWRINGRKSFTSMAVALDYSFITARMDDSNQAGLFFIDHRLDGVTVEETWDSISMRATKSDDLVLNNVLIPYDHLFSVQKGVQLPKGWILHIPAVYIGIAQAARDYAVEFANSYQPNTLHAPIKELPDVQRKVGEMELEIFKSRELLYHIAQKWVEQPDQRINMNHELAGVKYIATNSAIKVVDLAMRIVGARSLSEKNPLQRYFRDTRAGLHNPPPDDTVMYLLGRRRLDMKEKGRQ